MDLFLLFLTSACESTVISKQKVQFKILQGLNKKVKGLMDMDKQCGDCWGKKGIREPKGNCLGWYGSVD